ncbi:13678_t:CDS:2 [Gigaspora margarita]|uniref:13678_t:CDS:1 n=1 Tax=Gigaspora margarita TaxID=4874 RepID=A0ABN7WH61_GIGMA|nr:13678_t:CDS:2 [Gigaspora margarita]
MSTASSLTSCTKIPAMATISTSCYLFLAKRIGNTPSVVLEDPVIIKPQERLVGTKNKNKRMTQRELSEFEHVEKWHTRQCGTCHQIGHNCQTCPNASN